MAGRCVGDALFLLTCSTALEIRGEPIAKTEQLAENHCWWCQISFGIVPIKIVGLDTQSGSHKIQLLSVFNRS